jgi:hypothetical protein
MDHSPRPFVAPDASAHERWRKALMRKTLRAHPSKASCSDANCPACQALQPNTQDVAQYFESSCANVQVIVAQILFGGQKNISTD